MIEQQFYFCSLWVIYCAADLLHLNYNNVTNVFMCWSHFVILIWEGTLCLWRQQDKCPIFKYHPNINSVLEWRCFCLRHWSYSYASETVAVLEHVLFYWVHVMNTTRTWHLRPQHQHLHVPAHRMRSSSLTTASSAFGQLRFIWHTLDMQWSLHRDFSQY